MFNLSSLALSRSLSAGAVMATALTLAPSAYGFDPFDVDSFISGFCLECDISDALIFQEVLNVIEYIDINATGATISNSLWLGLSGFETITDIDFTGANFTFNEIESSVFNSSIFVDATFLSTVLRDIDFVSSTFTNAVFEDSFFRNVNFFGGVDTPAGFASLSSTLTPQNTGTDLTGTSFIGTEVVDSSFENADFAGADLTGSTFQNVNLLGANVNQQQLDSLAFFSGTLPDGTIVSVPEPSMMLGLFLLGGLGLARRKG